MKTPILKAGFKKSKEQQQLRKTYNVERDVVVVERKSQIAQVTKAILHFLWSVVKVLAIIAWSLLAIFGLCALLYPEIRSELVATGLDIYTEIQQMLGANT